MGVCGHSFSLHRYFRSFIDLKMAKENGNFQTLLLLRPLVNQQPPRSYYLIRFAHTDSLGRIEFV